MRQIKFRQKLKPEFIKNNECFHFWGYIDDGFVSPVNKYYSLAESEQFTGLKDVNGVDIYGGDIVLWGHIEPYTEYIPRKAVVEFSPEIAFKAFNLGENNHKFGFSNFMYKKIINRAMEVIGNIHQNPELLIDGAE